MKFFLGNKMPKLHFNSQLDNKYISLGLLFFKLLKFSTDKIFR